MKTASVALAAHIAQSGTTLARCALVTRTDATVFGFTDHDQAFTFEGVTYNPGLGVSFSAGRGTDQASNSSAQFSGFMTSAGVTDDDILDGLWDGAEVRLFSVNWADLSMGKIYGQYDRGRFGTVSGARGTYQVELVGLTAALNRTIGRKRSPLCDADFGDARCGKAKTLEVVSITQVVDQQTFRCSSLGHVTDGAYVGSLVTWNTGLNAGRSMDTLAYVGATKEIKLFLPMRKTITVGDSITTYLGCDKSAATCRTVHDNIRRFRGAPYLPGEKIALYGELAKR